jgi:hypothetical protein
MDNTVEIEGKSYRLKFPSLLHVKKVGNLMGYDPLMGDFGKIDWVSILSDTEKTMGVLKEILIDEVRVSILENLTTADFCAIVSAFFLKGQNVSLKFKDGLEHLESIFHPAEKSPPKDMPLITASSGPEKVQQK